MTTLNSQQRKQLRFNMRSRRRALSRLEQRLASQQLTAQVKRSAAFATAKRIALYLASDGEIDPRPLIELCWKLKKEVYLPVLHPVRHNRLWFTRYQPDTRLTPNKYGIPEPKYQRSEVLPQALNLVFMPLVAFDAQGGRMGMGGGYYDRTFAFTQSRYGLKGPKLIGLAHDFQQVEQLPVEPWDVPLDGVISDRRRYLV